MKLKILVASILTAIFFIIFLSLSDGSKESPNEDSELSNNLFKNAQTSSNSAINKAKVKSNSRINAKVRSTVVNSVDLWHQKINLDFSGKFSDIHEILEGIAGLKVQLVTKESVGVSIDHSIVSSYDKNKEYYFGFENMPVWQVIRYISISTGLRYNFDEGEGQITFVDRSIIMDKIVPNRYKKLEMLLKTLEINEDYSPSLIINGKFGSIYARNKFDRYSIILRRMGLTLDSAGAHIVEDKGEIIINTSESEHDALELLESDLYNPVSRYSESDKEYLIHHNSFESYLDWISHKDISKINGVIEEVKGLGLGGL